VRLWQAPDETPIRSGALPVSMDSGNGGIMEYRHRSIWFLNKPNQLIKSILMRWGRVLRLLFHLIVGVLYGADNSRQDNLP
jgi:hypothetical protein